MIIIDSNLEKLASQFKICDRNLVDSFSLKIHMGPFYHEAKNSEGIVVYGSHPDPSSLYSEKKTIEQNLQLPPGKQVIACSKDQYSIPLDYFGLVQTKGTLARMFVSTTCNDGQIEPGFTGHITLEIINHSPWTISLPVGSEIAQLYLFKCSTPARSPYSGRYSDGAKLGPTIAKY
ncbi:dCTP deaminase [compost metagenome]